MRRLLWVLAGAALLSAGCGAQMRPNLVLIALETTRADHLARTAEGAPVEKLGHPVRPLADRFDTLAELLRAAGWRE